jgi:maltooligosyltrehalose trehalohydrolase
LIDHERLKIAVAGMLMSPYVPMLFMGEEYAEDAPFYFFVSHSNKELIKAVREGRKKEFEAFNWEAEPQDPQDEKTFNSSKLNWSRRTEGEHALILGWYTELIALRRKHPALRNFNKNDIRAYPVLNDGLAVHRRCEHGTNHLLVYFNFSERELSVQLPQSAEHWWKIEDSKDEAWISDAGGNAQLSPSSAQSGHELKLPPLSVVMYSNKKGD